MLELWNGGVKWMMVALLVMAMLGHLAKGAPNGPAAQRADYGPGQPPQMDSR